MTNYKNHYRIGVDTVKHKNRITLTTVTNPGANAFLETLDDQFDFFIAYVKPGFEHRPDLISELFYDTPTYDWLIMLINNVDDPFEGLGINDRILLPRIN